VLKSKSISIVAAMDRNRLIGRGNALPWRLPADLARFKAITWGHPILMGRRTFESLGRALPGRTNIVLTRDPAYRAEGAVVVRGLDQALDAAGEAEEVFVIGGASFYAQCLPLAQRLYLTRVDAELEGDAWFPSFDEDEWREVAREVHDADARNPHPYAFVVLERRREAD
jgi:dihydrofolate reductase